MAPAPAAAHHRAMLDALIDLVSASPWTYAVVLGVAALDAVVPLVPSETTVIAAGVLAGAGELSLALVLAVAAAGAFVGDSSAYFLGRTLGHKATPRLFSGEKARKRLAQAERILASRGAYVIVVSRFIPGGRTVTMVTAGLTRMRVRTFSLFAALAAAIWASYAGLLGYTGGRTFEEHPWQGLLVALALAGAIGVALELRRYFRRPRSETGRHIAAERRDEPARASNGERRRSPARDSGDGLLAGTRPAASADGESAPAEASSSPRVGLEPTTRRLKPVLHVQVSSASCR